ncbi:MAG: NAD-glutamate dehydrogenase, partial [Janthinobacterium sp.]
VAGPFQEGGHFRAFLEWARNGGFEVFGYAYYRVKPGVRELERDIPSRVGVLQDTAHPVYGTCLANIPGDFDTLAKRDSALSIVKADVAGTLHRDQQLDFIGVRDMDAQGAILGEHCFVGLFTRAGNSTPLAALPFARGRVAKVLSLAGVRQQGFRAEKFREILESLPRTEALEADLDWLAQVCGAVVSLYKQPRTKVFARRDVYARHLNVLVYLPR